MILNTMPLSLAIMQRPSAREPSGGAEGERAAIIDLLRWLARSFAVLAVISGSVLLLFDLTPPLTSFEDRLAEAAPSLLKVVGHSLISALPLLFAGTGFLALQALLRPRFLELAKRLMLGAAFLLWGIVQLLPPGPLATGLGDLVIVLYVLDLGMIIWADSRKT